MLVFLFSTHQVGKAAIINTFTDRATWEAALTSHTVEDFTATPIVDPIPNNTVYSVGDFSVFYTTKDGVDESSNEVTERSTAFSKSRSLQLQIDTNGADETFLLELRFDSAISAFGADWDSVQGNLTITVVGETINLDTTLGPDDGFIGFTSDMTFTSFSFSATPAFSVETFSLDNVGLGVTAGGMAPIPEPSTVAIWAVLGIGLLAGQRRRKRIAA